jgi:hypothetical protein
MELHRFTCITCRTQSVLCMRKRTHRMYTCRQDLVRDLQFGKYAVHVHWLVHTHIEA